MSHPEQRRWCLQLKNDFPHFFKNKKVVDFGSLDINGNNRILFEDCDYTGVDIGPGPNVDIISLCHEFPGEELYDVVCSTEMLEHDMYWEKSLKRMYNLVKSEGLLFFTCKSTGSGEHGTINREPGSSPWTSLRSDWKFYYKNLSQEDIERFWGGRLQVIEMFSNYRFSFYKHYEPGDPVLKYMDLQFWGIKT